MRVLDNLTDHPMLRDVTLEQAVRYTMKFISRHGYNKLYQDKVATVRIHEWRGLLPCDCIAVKQVRDMKTGLCMRGMTDNFGEGFKVQGSRSRGCIDPQNNMKGLYIPEGKPKMGDATFTTNDKVIFTSFPEGEVEIAYKAIPVDDNGFPLLIDNETYLDALELYIKSRVFQVKFDQQKIPAGVLQEAKQDNAVAARLLQSEMTMPSPSEMQSIAAMWNTMIPRMREFDKGFRDLGQREYLRKV